MLKSQPGGKASHHGTIIGSKVKLTGSLHDEGPIVINGKVQGDLFSNDSIYIGESAEVEGPIKAQVIIIAGAISGEIHALESLQIKPTGQVSGKIHAKMLNIEPGARFNGQCVMSDTKEEKASQGEALKAED